REGKDDIILLETDEIKASDEKNAALTLPRLILARGPLKEPELVKNFFVISIICGIFAILSVLFTQITLGTLAIYIFFIVLIFLLAPIIYFLKKFPRIRGVIMLMMVLLIAAIIFFFLVEIIITLVPFNIELGVIRIPVNLIIILLLGVIGLLGWYYVTIKYFWIQIDKMKYKDDQKV
ncbi:MAG: hypothetical protein ACFFFB_24735, partial [Candidatus Heimdallarchaeota archaeon]